MQTRGNTPSDKFHEILLIKTGQDREKTITQLTRGLGIIVLQAEQLWLLLQLKGEVVIYQNKKSRPTIDLFQKMKREGMSVILELC